MAMWITALLRWRTRALFSSLLTTTVLCISGLSGMSNAATEVDSALLEKLAASMAEPFKDSDRFDAEVWLHASEQRLARYIDDHGERLALLQTVYREANRQELDADLVLAVMQVESAFDRFAISRVGAQGLMQVMPFWRVEIGRPQDILTDMDTNVRYGTAILAHYLDVSEGDQAQMALVQRAHRRG